jgi:hypothetical protein
MSFGATLTLTVNAVAKVLNRINNDNFGSVYLLKEATQEFRVNIRHSSSLQKSTGLTIDYHNLEVIQTVYGTSPAPDTVYKAYTVFTVPQRASLVTAGYLTAAQVDYVDSGTVQADLLSWQN